MTEESVKEMLKGVREEVRDSIQFSNESPEPPMSDLYTDVFVEPWGRYTGSSLPEFMGGADNVCGFRATDGKEGLVLPQCSRILSSASRRRLLAPCARSSSATRSARR